MNLGSGSLRSDMVSCKELQDFVLMMIHIVRSVYIFFHDTNDYIFPSSWNFWKLTRIAERTLNYSFGIFQSPANVHIIEWSINKGIYKVVSCLLSLANRDNIAPKIYSDFKKVVVPSTMKCL